MMTKTNRPGVFRAGPADVIIVCRMVPAGTFHPCYCEQVVPAAPPQVAPPPLNALPRVMLRISLANTLGSNSFRGALEMIDRHYLGGQIENLVAPDPQFPHLQSRAEVQVCRDTVFTVTNQRMVGIAFEVPNWTPERHGTNSNAALLTKALRANRTLQHGEPPAPESEADLEGEILPPDPQPAPPKPRPIPDSVPTMPRGPETNADPTRDFTDFDTGGDGEPAGVGGYGGQ